VPDKVVITNVGALRSKYGAAGWRRVKAALSALVKAYRKGGIVTRVVAIDDLATMRSFRARPVTSVLNCRQNKDAIDAVFKALHPDYLMLFGSIDVIPHQDLLNPAFEAGDDDDRHAWGDLPYACDAPYARTITSFVGPTRVVSRLPDQSGATDPSHVVKLLGTASRWKCRDATAYQPGFGLTAYEWRRSTELSVTNVFGAAARLRTSPKAGPLFARAEFGARAHFINCHGGDVDPQFYGQKGKTYPVALTSRSMAGRVTEGTVCAAECCYGGQLYADVKLGVALPICQSYLTQAAYAYFGSTTIAYGPSDGNGAADLLTQRFLIEILRGASVGRAALAARQSYVSSVGEMDPVDLKTLAQFCVYGDPSVQPVKAVTPTGRPKSTEAAVASRAGRKERRAKLASTGRWLQAEKPTAGSRATHARVSRAVRRVLGGLAREAGLRKTRSTTYNVKRHRAVRSGKGMAQPDRYHLIVGESSANRTAKPIVDKVVVVAKQVGAHIVGYRIYYAR